MALVSGNEIVLIGYSPSQFTSGETFVGSSPTLIIVLLFCCDEMGEEKPRMDLMVAHRAIPYFRLTFCRTCATTQPRAGLICTSYR